MRSGRRNRWVLALAVLVLAGASVACSTSSGDGAQPTRLEPALLTEEEVGRPEVPIPSGDPLLRYADPDRFVAEERPDDGVWLVEEFEPVARGKEAAQVVVDQIWGREDRARCWREDPPQLVAVAGRRFSTGPDDASIDQLIEQYDSVAAAEAVFDPEAHQAEGAATRGVLFSDVGADGQPADPGQSASTCAGSMLGESDPCEGIDDCLLVVGGSAPSSWFAYARVGAHVVSLAGFGVSPDQAERLMAIAVERLE